MNTCSSSDFSRNHAAGSVSSGSDEPRLVIVVGPSPDCAETVAQGFADQGETLRVMWFERAFQALAASTQHALVGVVVCQKHAQIPNDDLFTLRRALPDTPVLPWEHGHAA